MVVHYVLLTYLILLAYFKLFANYATSFCIAESILAYWSSIA